VWFNLGFHSRSADWRSDGAIARAKNSGVKFYLSELRRIKSQILAAQHDREPGMNCPTEALARAICARLGAEVDNDLGALGSPKTASAIKPAILWLSSTTVSRKDSKPRISLARCLRIYDSHFSQT
jgi:hypothetical protein